MVLLMLLDYAMVIRTSNCHLNLKLGKMKVEAGNIITVDFC